MFWRYWYLFLEPVPECKVLKLYQHCIGTKLSSTHTEDPKLLSQALTSIAALGSSYDALTWVIPIGGSSNIALRTG